MAASTYFQPYYYPTTVVFLDDNRDFLLNLSLSLSPNLAYRLSTDAQTLLDYLHERSRQPLYRRCFSYVKDLAATRSERLDVIRVNLTQIQHEVRHRDRFEEISVAVVDYDLPDMQGLEFCRRLRDLQVKTILLTGVADSSVAVEAFNSGLIDRYLSKQDAQIECRLNAMIRELQSAYFGEHSELVRWCVSQRSPGFLREPAFARLYDDIAREYGIVEHYFVHDPSGLLLVDAQGAVYRLIVLDEAQIQTHIDVAREHNASAELVARLESRRTLPYFWVTPDGHYRPEAFNWWTYLFDAQALDGESRYYYAIIPDPPNFSGLLRPTSSYSDYLSRLDNESVLLAG